MTGAGCDQGCCPHGEGREGGARLPSLELEVARIIQMMQTGR